MLGKNVRETTHLIDSDDKMRCHCLDDLACPLTCQVIDVSVDSDDLRRHRQDNMAHKHAKPSTRYDDHPHGLPVHLLLVARSPINGKGGSSGVAHLWDSDDETCHRRLDDTSCPLMCQVVCMVCYLWSPLVHCTWPLQHPLYLSVSITISVWHQLHNPSAHINIHQ